MKLRKPKDRPDFVLPSNAPDLSQENNTVTYTVKTITPIFGGGVDAGEPDNDMPIRASAIRGQLRYWWRFLSSHRKDDPLTGEILFTEERKIWGGMGEKGEDYASKVFVRVHNVSAITTKPWDENEVAYALFPAREDKNNIKDLIREGVSFKLVITMPQSEFLDIEKAIQWWANFGGIGARTRRGLGAVSIEEITPLTQQEVEAFGCQLLPLPESPSTIKAWEKSIAKLQTFRQGKNVARRPSSDPKNQNKLGRSFWPEPDSIRQITAKNAKGKHQVLNSSGAFPRAAFGLPIIFDFNVSSSAGEPSPTELVPTGKERMASPLILKAQAIGNDNYLPIALRLPTSHLKNLTLTLKGSNEGLPHSIDPIGSNEWWPEEPHATDTLAKQMKPLKGDEDDALTVFMNYFAGK